MRESPKLDRFIILGIFCAAFSFNYDFEDEPVKFLLMPLLYVAFSCAAIKLRKKQFKMNQQIETLITLVGIVGAFKLGKMMNLNHLVFIGNGLVIYQLLV